jgi:CheY-like chemotaxis protein
MTESTPMIRFRVLKGRGSRLLLVERDHAMAEMYRLSFLLRGFAIEVAFDCGDALRRVLDDSLPDVIVIDLGVPGVEASTARLDQLEMISTLHSIRFTEAIPIVALSHDAASTRDALGRGAFRCIDYWLTSPRQLAAEVDDIVMKSA